VEKKKKGDRFWRSSGEPGGPSPVGEARQGGGAQGGAGGITWEGKGWEILVLGRGYKERTLRTKKKKGRARVVRRANRRVGRGRDWKR